MKGNLLLLLLLCLGAVAQAQTGRIEGVVVNEKLKPLRYAFVRVKIMDNGFKSDEDRTKEIVAITNSSGEFLVEQLKQELYDVNVSLKGYTREGVYSVDVRTGQKAKLLVVMSRPKPDSKNNKSIKGMHNLKPVVIRAPRYEKPLIDPYCCPGDRITSREIEMMPVRDRDTTSPH